MSERPRFAIEIPRHGSADQAESPDDGYSSKKDVACNPAAVRRDSRSIFNFVS